MALPERHRQSALADRFQQSRRPRPALPVQHGSDKA